LALAATLALLAIGLLATPSASAAPPPAGFIIESLASPTRFAEADSAGCAASINRCDTYTVTVRNAGSAATEGFASSPVHILDELPAGLVVHSVAFSWTGSERTGDGGSCTSVAPLECSLSAGTTVEPDDVLTMAVLVEVQPGASGTLRNKVSVSGGGAPEVKGEEANEISALAPAFGFSSFDFHPVGVDGLFDSQAGAHPYELTVGIGLNNVLRVAADSVGAIGPTSVEDPKDIAVDLPLGFVGSTLAAPQCTLSELSSQQECPPDTKVGHIVTGPGTSGTVSVNSPIWNLVPERGYPAEFGYIDVLKGSHVLYTHVVPTPQGYVLQTISPDIPQISLDSAFVTFYGNPAERDASGNAQIPFFTNPTICSASGMTATAHMDSWKHPGRLHADGTPDLSDPAWVSRSSVSPPPTGCNLLAFSPELKAQPTTTQADTPSGLDFELKLAQSEDAQTNATPPLRNSSVTFPPGFTIDPSAGSGLQACSLAQIGWEGPETFEFNRSKPSCPEASKIGSLELESPLIRGVLHGAMYLAAQNENPFHSTLGLYVVVEDPSTGVLIKIAGRASADPSTGQITGTFNENPQLPFSDLKLHFFGGPRAEFATPERCGTYTTTSQIEPWSAPDSGLPATPFDSFSIDTGCVSGFNPSFTGGSTNLQAGAFTAFVASFTRSDSDEEMGGLSVSLPPGLLGKINGVPLCPSANASGGTCPENTKVGTVKAGAGPGPNPLFVTGNAYLTGPYKGAPYGLSVVVPAVAGPFNFGNVVVRQQLRIDPTDAHVTDISDPFPTILQPTGADGRTDGIPIRLRRIDVAIDRPGFTFNPTNCSKLQVGGTLSSTQGQSSALATPFQVTNCAALKFTPRITVTTAAKTSKANGSGLVFKIAYPKGAMGSQAWFNEAKFDLPKQLPARLTTIQQACLAATFEANPAGCPVHSLIGHAVVHTPVLADPLSGPVYFVSHGGAKFPDAVLVLQGDGVTVDLRGETFINGKTGITSATFRNTPDTPFESIEVTLPTGPFSEFGANLPAKANGSFCGQNLVMPTFFKASNGLQIKQNTKVGVTGCPKAKKKHKNKRKGHQAGRHGKKTGRRGHGNGR
jgi:hypothetical protein